MVPKSNRNNGYSIIELAFILLLTTFFAWLVISQVRSNNRFKEEGSQGFCIQNLRGIDLAKGQWALENHKHAYDIPTALDIQPFVGHGSDNAMPYCGADPQHSFETSYQINAVGVKPTCKINPSTHSF